MLHERLWPLVLKTATELRECIDSGEHPGAARQAALALFGEAEGLYLYGRLDRESYDRATSVLRGCDRAVTVYAHDPEDARRLLAERLKRREAELCGFGA